MHKAWDVAKFHIVALRGQISLNNPHILTSSSHHSPAVSPHQHSTPHHHGLPPGHRHLQLLPLEVLTCVEQKKKKLAH